MSTVLPPTLGVLSAIPLAVVQRTVPASALSRVVPECCGLVWNALRAQHVRGGRNVAIYWNAEIRLEVGVEVDAPFMDRDDLVRSATPAGHVVFATHMGPYGRLGQAHDAIRSWCQTQGHALTGPNWEIYGHWMPEWNHNPSLIRTDVFYLVTPGASG
ncbi:MAG TPA: GyrI-like domain-containing protein [Gemmatimonadaceae bacterium]